MSAVIIRTFESVIGTVDLSESIDSIASDVNAGYLDPEIEVSNWGGSRTVTVTYSDNFDATDAVIEEVQSMLWDVDDEDAHDIAFDTLEVEDYVEGTDLGFTFDKQVDREVDGYLLGRAIEEAIKATATEAVPSPYESLAGLGRTLRTAG